MPQSFFASRSFVRTAALVTLLAGAALSASAQPPAANSKDTELVRDFVHYIRIDRPDLAKRYADALLARLAPPFGTAKGDQVLPLSELVAIIEAGEAARFEDAASRGQRLAELEGSSGKLLKAYETGKLEQARAPEEIARNIAMLTGTQRARLIARERLAFAGEYALPQLLAALTKRSDPALNAEVRQLLTEMGKQAVTPLSVALPRLDPASQEQVATILANIPYRTSVPALAETMAASKVDAVKNACAKAITRLDSTLTGTPNVSRLFTELGESYYGEPVTLTSFPGEAFQLVWAFDPSVGLTPTPVDTRVYHETMTLWLAEHALKADPTNADAVALWLAANLKREIETPKDCVNPAYPKDRRDASYYAVAAGANPMLSVLARALDDRNTPLARRAIAALAMNAGSGALTNTTHRNALIEAQRYPNRRVQCEAALALAAAQPATTFDGAELVIPLLGSAIRDAGAKYAGVIATSVESQQSIANVLRGMGYTILPAASTLAGVEAALSDAPGVDLIVTDIGPGATSDTLATIRSNARFSATPVLALLTQEGVVELGTKFSRDNATRVIRSGTQPAQQAEAARQLVESAVGGELTPEEGAAYQDKALSALRDLALSANPVYNVADASVPLVTALNAGKGALKLRIAEVLANVGDKRVQTALADATIAAEGDEQTALIAHLTRSAKRFGNLLDDRQVRAFLAMANKGSDAHATSIAGLLGSLGLSNADVVGLITGKK